MDAERFAYSEYREYAIYKEMLKGERDQSFREILENLVRQEYAHYQFWSTLAGNKNYSVRAFEILLYKLMRKVLGLTFTLKFIEGSEKVAIRAYNEYLKTVRDERVRGKIQEIIGHEEEHERKIISTIKEERVEFISSIILGVNDGLIELTGALVGFALALRKPDLVALTGFITGLAASLSMASSAYMQAQYEEGKSALKAAGYTGVAYITVVCFLILPYVLIPKIYFDIPIMLAIAFVIIAGVSYYTSVVFERVFLRQLVEMVFFSLGVSSITFLIGMFLRKTFNIEV